MPMPQTARDRSTRQPVSSALVPGSPRQSEQGSDAPAPEPRGFGGGGPSRARRRSGGKRGPSLSKADWGPLGKHPDLDAIVARQRLHLPLSGRLTVARVNQAWKRCASEHHPDRGGAHDTMQLVNGARDLLLGRDLA